MCSGITGMGLSLRLSERERDPGEATPMRRWSDKVRSHTRLSCGLRDETKGNVAALLRNSQEQCVNMLFCQCDSVAWPTSERNTHFCTGEQLSQVSVTVEISFRVVLDV